MWSCACVPAVDRGVAGHCRLSDRRPCTPDWPAPGDPVVARASVLARHAKDLLLDVARDPRSARALTGLRAIDLAGDELAVPGEDVRAGPQLRLRENLASGNDHRAWLAESFSRPFGWALRMRFSVARYSFRASSSWSALPV